ncbi:MAG: gliding motility-associated ABC transporter permease subunit GldF, partial [Bacteroidota bacterium]|nr:gliding motility-associated ABC transporter permease subunit GldF [Bacteroidota bacterium]
MFALFKKELANFLNSLTGFIVLAVFVLANALFLWVFSTEYNIIDNGYASVDSLFTIAPFAFLFLVPAI